jgi:hypothetical protein
VACTRIEEEKLVHDTEQKHSASFGREVSASVSGQGE